MSAQIASSAFKRRYRPRGIVSAAAEALGVTRQTVHNTLSESGDATVAELLRTIGRDDLASKFETPAQPPQEGERQDNSNDPR